MQHYVIGFLFDEEYQKAVMIEKKTPEWQKGLWNGVGGKVEPNEDPYGAMCREFREETSVTYNDWILSATYYFHRASTIHVFYGSTKLENFDFKSVTVEKVAILDASPRRGVNVVEGVNTMISMIMEQVYGKI